MAALAAAALPGLAALAGPARASASACAAAEMRPLSLRLGHINEAVSPVHRFAVEVAEKVTAGSQGKIRIEVFPTAQLGNIPELMEQATLDQPIIFYAESGTLSTLGVRELAALGGPFLIRNLDEGIRLANSKLLEGWFDRLAARGKVRVLALNWFDTPRSILAKDRAFETPDKLKGFKIRVPQAPTFVKTFDLLGAVPVTLPFAEVYLGLQQGVVNGLEGDLKGMLDTKMYEVTNTVTLTRHFNLFLGWGMSERIFQSMAPACREFVTAEFRAGGERKSQAMLPAVAEAEAALKSRGLRFVEADITAYQAATAPFYSAFSDWPPGLLDQIRAATKGP